MKILVWNMNYWENINRRKLCDIIEWKNKCINFFLNEENIDFYILQEINPIKLFEGNHNQYHFSMTDYNILYHELTSELMYDGRRDNFWGNAIIYHKKFKIENRLIDFEKTSSNYYGRGSLMCYEFSSNNNDKITIINYYNKINYANRGEYNKFENDKDLINIIKKANTKIILAGDFNKGFDKNGNNCIDENYNDFIKSYEQDYNLIDCLQNYSKGFIPTSFSCSQRDYYLNDFCFIKNITGELVNKKDEWDNKNLWKGLSDHRALIIELK